MVLFTFTRPKNHSVTNHIHGDGVMGPPLVEVIILSCLQRTYFGSYLSTDA